MTYFTNMPYFTWEYKKMGVSSRIAPIFNVSK